MTNDELFDKVEKEEKKQGITLNISPLIIHISILLLLGLIIYFVFIGDTDFSEEEDLTLVLIGDVNNFSKEYSGDIFLYSAFYSLKTNNGEFDGENTEFSLKNFNGLIYLENDSIIFEGNSPQVHFGTNKLNLENEKFELKSNTKTTFDLALSQIKLDFIEGRIKFAEELNNDFKNTTVLINKYNTSITYDGTFSFKGISDSFNVNNKDRSLQILYNLE